MLANRRANGDKPSTRRGESIVYVLKSRYYVLGVALLAAALVLALAPVAQTGVSPTCFNRALTDVGTSFPDSIIGDPQSPNDNDNPNDVINGLGGDDPLIRGEGDFGGTPEGGVDYLCGGAGNEGLIDGADKSDFVMGGKGDDVVDGDNFPSPFGDFLMGEVGNDTHTGGQGDDTIRGGRGDDMVDVGAGTVPEGADNIKTGAGDDTINGVDDGSVDRIKCGTGEDTVTAGPEDIVAANCEDVS